MARFVPLPPLPDRLYVRGNETEWIRWIWYPGIDEAGQLYVHLEEPTDATVGEDVEVRVSRDGEEIVLQPCILRSRFFSEQNRIWVEIYDGAIALPSEDSGKLASNPNARPGECVSGKLK